MSTKLRDLVLKKQNNQKAVLITAYDFSSASVIDKCGVDAVLVGDSASMVVFGHSTTLDITLDEIIMLAKGVRRGTTNAYMIVDMPFMSYQPSDRDAVKNCGRVLVETHCNAVKMEGGRDYLSRISSVIRAGIPVCGHIGMRPQMSKLYEGFPIKGLNADEAEEIMKDALALQSAGIAMLIIENVPDEISSLITKMLKIPVYSIGSGTGTDGQIIVFHDILGLYTKFKPRFIKLYEHLAQRIEKAVKSYASDVRMQKFPQKSKTPHMEKGEYKKLISRIG